MNPEPSPDLPSDFRAEIDSTQLVASRFSAELKKVLEVSETADGITIGQMLALVGDRGHAMLLFLATFPFLIPVPTTFGLSTPVGVAAVLIGLYTAINRDPWLPAWLLRRRFPKGLVRKLVGGIARQSERIERLCKPRLAFLIWGPGKILVGISLLAWGIVLAGPGFNFIPAAPIVILALGLIFRDGVLILLGHATTVGLVLTLILAWEAVVWAMQKIGFAS